MDRYPPFRAPKGTSMTKNNGKAEKFWSHARGKFGRKKSQRIDTTHWGKFVNQATAKAKLSFQNQTSKH